MEPSPRPFTAWMRLAQDGDSGSRFLDHATRHYREDRDLRPGNVISGVGRGFTLLRNARKWKRPMAGSGSQGTMEARGRQWRLVMAYGGFEIFAKAMMCHFKDKGPPHVSHFVQLAHQKIPALAKRLQPLPTPLPRSRTAVAKAGALMLEGKADHAHWRGWLDGGDSTSNPVDRVQLARVVRNLSAHGLLAPDVAISLKAVDLCDALVDALVDVADVVITAGANGSHR